MDREQLRDGELPALEEIHAQTHRTPKLPATAGGNLWQQSLPELRILTGLRYATDAQGRRVERAKRWRHRSGPGI